VERVGVVPAGDGPHAGRAEAPAAAAWRAVPSWPGEDPAAVADPAGERPVPR